MTLEEWKSLKKDDVIEVRGQRYSFWHNLGDRYKVVLPAYQLKNAHGQKDGLWLIDAAHLKDNFICCFEWLGVEDFLFIGHKETSDFIAPADPFTYPLADILLSND